MILPPSPSISNANDSAIEEEASELFEHYRFTIDRGQTPIRIDKYLAAHIEGISRSRIQNAAEADYILVNNLAVKASYLVKPFDQISIVMPYRRRGVEIIPQEIPLDIVFEDPDLLVINKPAGLVVHPGHGNYSGTLINGIAWHLGIRNNVEGDERMGMLVHRIDKNTSGLLVVAKTEEAQFGLSRQFYNHIVQRIYLALAWGNLPNDHGSINYSICRDPGDRTRFKAVGHGGLGVPLSLNTHDAIGKQAVTHYQVLERFGYVSLISCRLETGRTHQIRVHLQAIGHPLFNDERYGGDQIRSGTLFSKFKEFVENCFKVMPHHALHAETLGFIHPKTKEKLHFSVPLPKDFMQVLNRWRNYGVRL